MEMSATESKQADAAEGDGAVSKKCDEEMDDAMKPTPSNDETSAVSRIKRFCNEVCSCTHCRSPHLAAACFLHHTGSCLRLQPRDNDTYFRQKLSGFLSIAASAAAAAAAAYRQLMRNFTIR